MKSILIKDTTSMERIQIVKEALEGEYDEFYDDYIAGKKELTEINREYSEQFAGTGQDDQQTYGYRQDEYVLTPSKETL